MKTIYILKGLPASGKSTWAKNKISENPNGFKRINKDDLRGMLDDGHFSRGNEKFIIRVRDMLLMAALHDGKHVISDDTNLATKHETRMRQLAKQYTNETGQHVKVEVIFFDITVEECIRRDLKRNRSVGEKVIKSMYKRFLAPKITTPKLLEQDATLPKALMCDLDGTLAILNRNPFDASTCEDDGLNVPVANIVKRYFALGYAIILVSGRQDTYKPQTIKFLAKHEIPYTALHMRKEGDSRKDSIIKEEIFEGNIKGKWFIEFVLDDRNQVVDKWREMGLICLQVAEGDF